MFKKKEQVGYPKQDVVVYSFNSSKVGYRGCFKGGDSGIVRFVRDKSSTWMIWGT